MNGEALQSRVIVGYAAKQIATGVSGSAPQAAGGDAALIAARATLPGVQEVLSVSDCISRGIPADSGRNQFLGFFPSEAEVNWLLEGSNEGFRVFFYRALPIIFDDRVQRPLPLPVSSIEPDPHRWVMRGFDAVVVGESGHGTFWLGCSPLSCNAKAQVIHVNRGCLLDTGDEAREVAERFAVEEPEPGPYIVVEVWERAAEPA